MARKAKSMRHVKEILRLRYQNGLSVREIARSCGLPTSTVGDYVRRAEKVGLSWPLPAEWTDAVLMEKLMAVASADPDSWPPGPVKPLPDWPGVQEQLKRKGVTLKLLWQEYRQAHPVGYGYSRFCELYERWVKTLDPVLRQVHAPGEKLFVDWAGQTIPIYQADGTASQASLFVTTLGASHKIYAAAFADQALGSWISGHTQAFEFYGGVTRALVPDNPKTAVTRPNRYEPVLQRTYREMAEHYGTVIIPARIKKPRDKAPVETSVQIAERQILAVLRDRRFFSVGELNQAIRPLLDQLNNQPFQKREGSRNSCFEAEEKAHLLPLPAAPFVLATWSEASVNIDYHVVADKHYYSVPYTLIHKKVDVRLTAATVEIFYQGQRVAAHARQHQPGRFSTQPEHRPKSHQKYLEWTPGRIIQWAQKLGPNCGRVVQHIMESKPHPEQGFRSCLGIIRLGKALGESRLEAACARAWHFGTCSYLSIKSILENRLDQQPWEQELALNSPAHENVRGSQYYTQTLDPLVP